MPKNAFQLKNISIKMFCRPTICRPTEPTILPTEDDDDDDLSLWSQVSLCPLSEKMFVYIQCMTFSQKDLLRAKRFTASKSRGKSLQQKLFVNLRP